jgi:hypothetical protein
MSHVGYERDLMGVWRRIPYYWWWTSRLPERRMQGCWVTARGTMNTIRVEFLDGFVVFTSRYAVRRVPE